MLYIEKIGYLNVFDDKTKFRERIRTFLYSSLNILFYSEE